MSKKIALRVRHNRNRALILRLLGSDEGGWTLTGVQPLHGPVPSGGLDLGMRFRTVKEARQRAIEALKGEFDDVLDAINLSVRAYTAWHMRVRELAIAVVQAGIPESALPTERARVMEGGALEVYLDLPPPLGRQSLIIPPGEWAWRH